jgi:PIN domain nuclease of toxin-antitoxin system
LSVLLDTHIWVWWLTPQSSLRRAERDGLDILAERGELFLSAISLWETQVLHARRRLELPLPFSEWLAQAADSRIISLLPIDVEVVSALDALPASFHADPADRLIVATARAHVLPLATRDANIRKSRVVPIWRP